jgi:hypothetical protein
MLVYASFTYNKITISETYMSWDNGRPLVMKRWLEFLMAEFIYIYIYTT